MQIANAIVGHAVVIPLLFALLAGLFLVVYRLDRKSTIGSFAAPLNGDSSSAGTVAGLR